MTKLQLGQETFFCGPSSNLVTDEMYKNMEKPDEKPDKQEEPQHKFYLSLTTKGKQAEIN